MWACPVNETTELVSGMAAPQFEDESSWVRGSELVQGSSGSFVSFLLIVDVFTNLEGYAHPRLKAAYLDWLVGGHKFATTFGTTRELRFCGHLISHDVTT
jgi:hypothetical protein